VLPGGGIYLTRSARFAGPGVQPGFVAEASGCRVTDVDGRRYVDFLCANGPILLGYRHPEVEEAARRQAGRADAASYFPPALVELAEALVARFRGFAWAVPAKNGSDVVGLAARVARAATGRDVLLRFEHAYHGFDPEWVPGAGGVPAAHRACVRTVPWNDAQALQDAAEAVGGDLAGIVMNPLDQSPAQDTRAPSAELLRAVTEVRARHGALLVVDDVRHGFRIHPAGSHVALGLEPDLLCLGKGLGNGYAVSALLGTEALRTATRSLAFTASHVFGAVALRAALTTLAVYDREHAFAAIERAGLRLREGLEAAAKAAGHRIRITGPPAMPTLLFDDDPELARGRRFSQEAARRGALFHPNLNGFLGAAHDDAAIDEAVAAAADAFRATPPA
jgi:glutamate-1-semialdehyde 2,1-aminomutase